MKVRNLFENEGRRFPEDKDNPKNPWRVWSKKDEKWATIHYRREHDAKKAAARLENEHSSPGNFVVKRVYSTNLHKAIEEMQGRVFAIKDTKTDKLIQKASGSTHHYQSETRAKKRVDILNDDAKFNPDGTENRYVVVEVDPKNLKRIIKEDYHNAVQAIERAMEQSPRFERLMKNKFIPRYNAHRRQIPISDANVLTKQMLEKEYGDLLRELNLDAQDVVFYLIRIR